VAQVKKKKPIALLTSCSVTRTVDPIVKIADAPIVRTMDELCEWWADKMQMDYDGAEKTPGEIYGGTGFTAITEIAQDIGHENVFIVTGGTGLARYTDEIVPYDFTADKKADFNAHQHITGEKFLPHIWWGKVNQALNGSATPIADLLSEYEIVVGALPKIFTKYILDDLMVCKAEDRANRIFIPMTVSMYNGVPTIVRDAYVPYVPAYLGSVMYSRGDKAQRVVQKFLREASSAPIGEVAKAMKLDAAELKPTEVETVDYKEMFEAIPSIIEAEDVGTALHRAKTHGYKIGGNARFAGAWRAAKGILTVEVSKSAQEQGVNILAGILSRADRMSDEEALLGRLGAFIVAAREVDAHIIFTAAEVVEWAKVMYEDDLQGMDNTNKVSYLLSYNAKYLGVTELKAGSRKGYKLNK